MNYFMPKTRLNIAGVDIKKLISPPYGITSRPNLAYKYINQSYDLKLTAEKVDPRITADVFTFLSVAEELMLVNSIKSDF